MAADVFAHPQDDKLLQTLMDHLSPKLLAIARGYVAQEAEDAVQEVWMKLARFRSIMEPPEYFDAYMAASVRHQCIDMLRKQARRPQAPLEAIPNIWQGMLADYADPETLTLQREDADTLTRCIHLLPELYALPIHLYYREELPLRTIGELLALPVSTVKWRLYHGRMLLKKTLFEGGYLYDKK